MVLTLDLLMDRRSAQKCLPSYLLFDARADVLVRASLIVSFLLLMNPPIRVLTGAPALSATSADTSGREISIKIDVKLLSTTGCGLDGRRSAMLIGIDTARQFSDRCRVQLYSPNSITPTSPKLPRTGKFRGSRRNGIWLKVTSRICRGLVADVTGKSA